MLQRNLIILTGFVLSQCVGSVVVQANPLFAIGDGTGTTWTQAIANGDVAPISSGEGLNGAAASYFNDRLISDPTLDGFLLQTSTLVPDVFGTDGNGETHEAMRMEWPVTGDSSPGNNVLDIGGWRYTYDSPVDLTGTYIQSSILAREGVADVLLGMVDANGKARTWFWTAPVTEDWFAVTFDADLGMARTGWGVVEDPGFDITAVEEIEGYETWNGKRYYDVNGVNYWDYMRVSAVPEPASLALLALGGLSMLRRSPNGGKSRRRKEG